MADPSDGKERLERLRRFLEKNYQVEIASLTRLDRGVYRAERSPGPSWVVRIFPEERELERARGDAAVLQFLAAQDFPSERCAAAEPVTNPAKRGVLVTEFEEGAPADNGVVNSRWLGSVSGWLHTLRPRAEPLLRPAGALHIIDPNGGLPADEIRRALAWLEELEGSVPPKAKAAFLHLREHLSTADDASDLPVALIHPDAVVRNVIETHGHQMRLVDWTGAGTGPRAWALAWTIWACAFAGEQWSPEQVRAAVEGYRAKIELEPDEIDRLPELMAVRPMVLAAFRIRRFIKAGKSLNGHEWWWPDENYTAAIANEAQRAFRLPRAD